MDRLPLSGGGRGSQERPGGAVSGAPRFFARAVEVAARGEVVAPRKLLEFLIANEEPGDLEALTPRQRDILGLVAEGLSNAEVARRLFLSESTVKQHLRATYKVLGVKDRKEAA